MNFRLTVLRCNLLGWQTRRFIFIRHLTCQEKNFFVCHLLPLNIKFCDRNFDKFGNEKIGFFRKVTQKLVFACTYKTLK